MGARKPAVAGQFYGGSYDQCLHEVRECLQGWSITAQLPSQIVAGIVPHAGWVFSGNLAGMVFSAIKQVNGAVDTFVIFGAVHRYCGNEPAVYDSGNWQTPLGDIAVDEELAGQILEGDIAIAGAEFHTGEHSIEVQVPFVQHLFPEAKIVPVMVPSGNGAVGLGQEVASVIERSDKKIVCIASTDLTHYGPRYGFCPAGSGPEGLKWAKETNDAEFIDLAVRMEADELLNKALENSNACGPGAAAAAVSAAKKLGREKGVLLAYTDSNEVMIKRFHQSSAESVGYAAIVF